MGTAADSSPPPSGQDNVIVHARMVFERQLDDGQRRLVRIVLVIGAVLLAMLAVTGVWQFFLHEPDPEWIDIGRDEAGIPPELEEGGSAGFHGLWSTLTGVLIVVGGGIFALRVAHRVPRALWMSFLVVLGGAITGQLIRFVAIEPNEGPRSDEAGYVQVFSNGNEYILTDDRAYSPTTFALLVLLHVAMLPLLGLTLWYGLRRLRRVDPDDRSAERVGWDVKGLNP